MARPVIPLEKKFLIRLDRIVVNPESACWLWADVIDKDGYGIVQHTQNQIKQHIRAHRLSYEYHKGPIPNGLVLDHICRTRNCINPHHLEAVTIGENVKRGSWSLKTHCPRGHPYSGQNLYKTKQGRQCRECKRTLWKTYKRPKKS